MRLAALALLALTTSAVAQTDLNAPVDEKPTIASEVKRGIGAAMDCRGTGDFNKCVLDAASANTQKQPNTNSFELGLFYEACQESELHADVDKRMASENSAASSSVPSDMEDITSNFELMLAKQRLVKVSDQQLVALDADRTPESRARMLEWIKTLPR